MTNSAPYHEKFPENIFKKSFQHNFSQITMRSMTSEIWLPSFVVIDWISSSQPLVGTKFNLNLIGGSVTLIKVTKMVVKIFSCTYVNHVKIEGNKSNVFPGECPRKTFNTLQQPKQWVYLHLDVSCSMWKVMVTETGHNIILCIVISNRIRKCRDKAYVIWQHTVLNCYFRTRITWTKNNKIIGIISIMYMNMNKGTKSIENMHKQIKLLSMKYAFCHQLIHVCTLAYFLNVEIPQPNMV